ncbi:flavodoxin family protein [Chloroflexota bacterium]
MKITVFNGSPRGAKGNTNIVVEEFLAGAIESGAEVENIFLVKKSIKHCLACYDCWEKTLGECVLKDDMKDLLPKFIGSDIAVFATPVYIDIVSGAMKDFMDRLIPVLSPYFEKDEKGECRHRIRYEKYPKIMVISSCGYPEQSHFQVLSLLFRRMARNFHSEVVAEIFRSSGGALRSKSLVREPVIRRYKQLLRRAGREVAANSRLSEETAAELGKPIISVDQFIERANRNWDKRLSTVTAVSDS